MRTMFDSTSASDIPSSAALVAGYTDGLYRWSDADWARFPNAVHVRIAAFASTDDGHVLDVETGDATPAQAPGWGRMRQRSGQSIVTFYCNRSNRPAVEDALHAAGFGATEACLWVSTLDNTMTVAPSPYGYAVVAVQYAGSNLSGGHYDLSTVADYWPGVDRPGGITPSEVIVMDQAAFDQLVGNNPYLQDIAYRLEMLAQNEGGQQGGPSKGQANKLKAELDAINGVTLLRMEGEIKALQAAVDKLSADLATLPAAVPAPTHFAITGTATAS